MSSFGCGAWPTTLRCHCLRRRPTALNRPPVGDVAPALGERPRRVTTSLSEPPHHRSALRPEADTLNQPVRSRITPPERGSFEPAPLRAPSNPLNYRAFNICTKMAVVRLLRRKWAERDEKRPEVGLGAAARGSDKWPEKPTFCGFPTEDQERKKNVPTGRVGGGREARPETFSIRAHPSGECCKGRDFSAGRARPAGPYGA
jgi:hypothetical protein